MIRVKHKWVVINNVQWLISGGNSYYEKFVDGKIICIDEEIPFEIPQGWEWARISSIFKTTSGGTPDKGHVEYYSNPTIPWLRSGELDYKYVTETELKISESGMNNSSAKLFPVNTVVVAMYGATVGQVSILGIETTTNQAICGIFPIDGILPEYLFYFFQAKRTDYLEKAFGSGQPNISQEVIKKTLLPIPPYKEQQRIVTKADYISALVDKFDSSQKRLNSLNTSIKTNFRKSILQDAIQGRLVNQDLTDDPVNSLLEQINKEKGRLLQRGFLKKKDMVDSVIFKGEDNKYYEKVGGKTLDITDEIPFDIPSSWVWVRLSTIANLYTGNSISETEKKARYTGKDGKDYIGTKDVGFDSKVNYKNGIAIPDKYITDFKIAKEGSVLLCIEGGSAGRKVAILDRDVCFGNKLCCFFPFGSYAKYIYYYIQSPSFFEIFQKNKTGIIGGVSVNTLKDLLVAFPPKQEQERICLMIDKTFSAL